MVSFPGVAAIPPNEFLVLEVRNLFTHEVHVEPGDWGGFPMNFEVQESPTLLLRGEVPTNQIRLDFFVPNYQRGSIRPFVDVLVEILNGRYCATNPDVNVGVALRTEPGVARD